MRALLASLFTAAAIAPPVIHEPFTALTCPLHPDSTIEIEACQEHRVLRTDRQIDLQVKSIFKLLKTDQLRAPFVTSERTWLRYRRQSCATQASKYAGGTAYGVAFLSCTLQRNKTHLADLSAMRTTLAQH